MRKIDIKIGRRINTAFPSNYGVSKIEMYKCDILFVHDGDSDFNGCIEKNRFGRFNLPFNKTMCVWDLLKMFNHLPRKQKKQLKNSVKKQIQAYINNY